MTLLQNILANYTGWVAPHEIASWLHDSKYPCILPELEEYSHPTNSQVAMENPPETFGWYLSGNSWWIMRMCNYGNLLVYHWGKVPHCESKTASKTSKNTSMKLSHKTQAARWSLAMAAMPEPATLLFFKMSLSGQKTRGSLTWTMRYCLFQDGILIN